MTHLQAALKMGEEIVDRNPNFCLTSECGVANEMEDGRGCWFACPLYQLTACLGAFWRYNLYNAGICQPELLAL